MLVVCGACMRCVRACVHVCVCVCAEIHCTCESHPVQNHIEQSHIQDRVTWTGQSQTQCMHTPFFGPCLCPILLLLCCRNDSINNKCTHIDTSPEIDILAWKWQGGEMGRVEWHVIGRHGMAWVSQALAWNVMGRHGVALALVR